MNKYLIVLQEARNIRGIVIDYFPFISYIHTQKKGEIEWNPQFRGLIKFKFGFPPRNTLCP